MPTGNGVVRVVSQLTQVQTDDLMAVVAACATPNDDGCLVVDINRNTRLSLNEKEYVQIKIKPDKDNPVADHQTPAACKNKKVLLHQLVMWVYDLEGVFIHRPYIAAGRLEMSHLCSVKTCANPNHLYAEESAVNKSRNYCPVVVYINDKLVPQCKHSPRCITTQHKKLDAYRHYI